MRYIYARNIAMQYHTRSFFNTEYQKKTRSVVLASSFNYDVEREVCNPADGFRDRKSQYGLNNLVNVDYGPLSIPGEI